MDEKPLKTPNGNQVIIPRNKQILAAFTAAEWQGQEKKVRTHSFPVSSLVVRALDSFQDPVMKQKIIQDLLKYIHTDAIWYI